MSNRFDPTHRLASEQDAAIDAVAVFETRGSLAAVTAGGGRAPRRRPLCARA
jgi:hypothetical protein